MVRPRTIRMLRRTAPLTLLMLLAPRVAGAQDAEETPPASDTTSTEATSPAPPTETPAPSNRRVVVQPTYVIGERPGDLAFIPGSASYVTEDEIQALAPKDANEVLRTLPGVNVVDEEGIGLRLNIGIRGLNPDRGRNILVLEDGVPVALAPYGEPELYYSPPIERMEAIELVKGSGSILFGPQTIGGVLNYRTLAPPQERTIRADVRYGSYDYLMASANVGDTVGQVGYLVHGMHRRFTGPRQTNVEVTDLMSRFHLQFNERTSVGIKLSLYDETSNSTYVGLTQPQFEANPQANFAAYDVLPVRRYGASITLGHLLTDRALLQTTFYAHYITRNWRRQDYDRTPAEGRTYERAYDGNGSPIVDPATGPTDRSAIYFRDSNGSRNRAFTVAGVEPRLSVDYDLGPVQNELTVGMRFHYEQTDEQRVDGPRANALSGTLREDELRTGYALAGYALNQFTFADRFRVSPGVRVEYLNHERDIFRRRVDGVDTSFVPSVAQSTTTLAVIPGVGASVDVFEGGVVFAGAHRGFAPPRTKDAVTSDGESLELEAEYSWNYELGFRYAGDWVGGEVTGFFLDFDNQIIPPAQSAGAQASPAGLINGGQTYHAGVEFAGTVDAARAAGASFRVPLTLAYTFVDARFQDGWNEDIAGNRMPYAPAHIVNANLQFIHPIGISATLNANFVTEQFTDNEETREASLDGLRGVIDPRLLLDARIAYTYAPSGLTLYVSGKNLTDETWIASRRPEGIQPGVPRLVMVGLSGRW